MYRIYTFLFYLSYLLYEHDIDAACVYFENFRNFKSACFVYKCLNDLAPPPLKEFIHKKRDSGYDTRSASRGDCEVHGRKSTFSQNVLSIKGCQYWNELPLTLREIPTFTAFKGQLKQWLKNNQSCDHV